MRQAVSSPVVDDSESDHNHLLDMMGMERPLVTKLLPKPAALNATAALCHMARSDAARDHMAHVRPNRPAVGKISIQNTDVRQTVLSLQSGFSCHMFEAAQAFCLLYVLRCVQVGLMEVLFDAHHGQNQSPLKERCKMLLNLLVSPGTGTCCACAARLAVVPAPGSPCPDLVAILLLNAARSPHGRCAVCEQVV